VALSVPASRASRLLPRRRRLPVAAAGRRRPSPWLERRTLALGVAALGSTAAAVAVEVGRVWRRGSAPLPRESADVLGAAAVAARETGEVTVAAYQEASGHEAAVLNLLGSFVLTFGFARVSTWIIRRRGPSGPFRDLMVGNRHVHHFVPGIVLAFAAGGTAIVSADDRLEPWLAIPFGVGLGLTLDESALLLRLDDVYWTEEGVLSVQITLTTIAVLASAAAARRLLRRGERVVLEASPPPPRAG